jgi:transcription-repair coupling factor (superfamily II helicase)
VAAGYERVDQVDDRGQFAVRGGILDLYPATEDRAVRIDLFDIEVESIRFFSTFTQRSLGETEAIEIAPAAELAPEHRELAEIAALEDAEDRPDVAELLPVDRFQAFLDLAADAAILIAAEEDVRPALADHWQDVCAAFHDDDAHHLYVKPDAIAAALDARAERRLSSISPTSHRVPRPGRRPRRALAQGGRARAREARALGLPHGGHVDAARRRRARRLQPRAPARLVGRRRGPAVLARDAARRLHRRRPAPGGHPRPPALPPPPRRASGAADAAGAARCARSPTCAPATSSSTRTTASPASPASTRRPVAGVTRDYLELEYAGTDRVFMPVDQLAKITPLRRRGGATRR